MIGKTLAHYTILGHLGSGGMGEVYRAQDTKLSREVALKLLPSEFSHDPERVARFEREATTLAKLQHANIATIYGFEHDEAEDVRFLVMELVEGEDLSERLASGAIAPRDAITIAAQIAEGLEAAHNLGIVHRDLKPANIKLTPLGDVKILDFGLAKAYALEDDREPTIEISNSPTITAAMTLAGTILGTAAYMSPEQARGKFIDRQSDIWSFGVVLYEMLTAEKLFGGETVSDSIGAILHRDPDLALLPNVPSQVETLLRRCLARDKRARLRDIGDARLELADAQNTQVAEEEPGAARSTRLPWLVAGALAVLVVAIGWLGFARGPQAVQNLTTLGLPREEAIDLGIHNAWPAIAFSPDGRQVVYIGGEEAQLFRRDVDSFDSAAIPGASDVSMVTFSPDGLWLAYKAESKLWKVALSGGAPIEICDIQGGPGLAWGDGEIYFPQTNGGSLWSVPVDGGEPRQISTIDAEREETSHRWPHVLPGGKHLLFTIKTARITTFDDAQIGLLSLESGEVEVLLTGGMSPRYLDSGHIVYGRESQLFTVPFDLATLTVEGTPTRVLEEVDTVVVNGCAQFALSAAGDLAYLSAGEDQAELQLTWLYTSGRTSRVDIDDSYFMQIAIRPDGEQMATLVPAANDKIFIYDFSRRTLTRLTNLPGNDTWPSWSPDGSQVAFGNDRDGSIDIYVMPADGSSPARRVVSGPDNDIPDSWSPDGNRILFTRADAGGKAEICSVPSDGSGEPTVLYPADYTTALPQVSPDGRWLAYVSDSSGDFEVYARPYDRPGSPVRISVAGGEEPRWSPDGRTIYYRTDSEMMAVTVTAGGTLRAEPPVALFELDPELFGKMPIMPEGDRFLANRADPELRKHSGIRVVFGWAERLKDLQN